MVATILYLNTESAHIPQIIPRGLSLDPESRPCGPSPRPRSGHTRRILAICAMQGVVA